MPNLPQVDREVFGRYAGRSLPRHVSYPMPTWWGPVEADQVVALTAASRAGQRDLSVYLHIPFCEALCKFCACNRTIMPRSAGDADQRTQRYVEALCRQIVPLAASLGASRPVRQIHWGGGTPTYLSCAQIASIHDALAGAFRIDPHAELAIEIDPRVTTQEQLHLLRRLGFNRVSLGVQDFDRQVQHHVRRTQPFEMVKATVKACREIGFASVNFDLIYGMPYQTARSIDDLIDRTLELGPDRIAFYHYAQIPERIATQRGMHHDRMPAAEDRLTMFLAAMARFTGAGYRFIGLDHFALPTESLARAADRGTLRRNFQGMTTGAGLDVIGLGASAISHFIDRGYLQNVHDPQAYTERMEQGHEPVVRGVRLRPDDCIRHAVIEQIYCYARLDPAPIERRFGIDFSDHFATELRRLSTLEADGLVRSGAGGVVVLTEPMGRLLMRHVAAVFDAYLEAEAYRLGENRAFSASA